MKKILNALFLTIITLVTFSCSDVPALMISMEEETAKDLP